MYKNIRSIVFILSLFGLIFSIYFDKFPIAIRHEVGLVPIALKTSDGVKILKLECRRSVRVLISS